MPSQGTRAADRYELVGPIDVPLKRTQLLGGILQAIHGTPPLGARPTTAFEIRERATGRVVYRTTTRNEISLEAWQETLSSDLENLTVQAFDDKWGVASPAD